MDHVSSLECLKLDSQSEVLDKDVGVKDLLSPDTVPLNCDTPVIDTMAEERKVAKQCFEELSTYFKLHWTPPPNPFFGIKADAPKDKSSIGECLYCLKVGDHISDSCPYKSDVPMNAIVSSACVIFCKVCGCRFRGSCCAKCGPSQGRAELKRCSICRKEGEHMTYDCPSREKKYYPSIVFNGDPYTGAFSFEYAPLKGVENGEF
ncbi:uncharacterized protein LOC110774078 isoform X1 [Prunus avium]|uniref:Uncharacterized protein LOC110774078 isoform X1 n=1 Tax=Prunus avium TaxID=42229 RepID=A0A6P5U5A8_PRUAV|nr:uncharacterized protein LOC110774078 isoform X1 [Prunus avium]